jgi:hypothetical protein
LNRKILLSCLLIFNIAAIPLLSAIPVHAYTYHGAQSRPFERGGHGGSNWYLSDDVPGTGYLLAACGKDDYGYGSSAWAYLNSYSVKVDDEEYSYDNVRVYVWWVYGHNEVHWVGDSTTFQCKLYVNGYYQDTKVGVLTNGNGSTYFDFDVTVYVDNDLDVDLVLLSSSSSSGYFADIHGNFTYVAFTSED